MKKALFWRNGYFNKAEEIKDIPFQILNAENISKLGVLKPNIQFLVLLEQWI